VSLKCEFAGQPYRSRRAKPSFLSIQLTHVSFGVTESELEAVNPQFRGLARVFCSCSAEAGSRRSVGIHGRSQ
jgi:hypothetical protein